MGWINALARVAHAPEEGEGEGEGEVIASTISISSGSAAMRRAPDCYCAVIRMHGRAWILSSGKEGISQNMMSGGHKSRRSFPYCSRGMAADLPTQKMVSIAFCLVKLYSRGIPRHRLQVGVGEHIISFFGVACSRACFNTPLSATVPPFDPITPFSKEERCLVYRTNFPRLRNPRAHGADADERLSREGIDPM